MSAQKSPERGYVMYSLSEVRFHLESAPALPVFPPSLAVALDS